MSSFTSIHVSCGQITEISNRMVTHICKTMRESQKPVTLDIPGLTRSSLSPNGYIASRGIDAKLIIIMVGLPARGKSYIVRKLARYLNWLQHGTRVFNVGERRRSARNTTNQVLPHSADFFDPTDPKFVKLRDILALEALNDLLDWLAYRGGTIGILDATNSTQQRRQTILNHIRQRHGPQANILFLESCCLDQTLLERNFRLKLSGPDYRDQKPETALADFRRRVSYYERSYSPLGVVEESLPVSFVQLIDVGRKINIHMIQGYLATQVVEYLLNFNLSERQIWISCNGESIDDVEGKIGRGSPLSDHGSHYSKGLAGFIQEQREEWEQARAKVTQSAVPGIDAEAPRSTGFCVWTSMMPQAVQTSMHFPDDHFEKKQIKLLDDLNAGDMAGLTFEQIRTTYPAEFSSRKRSKLLYRWPGPGGEAYADVINRLRPVILDLERMTNHLLLITHRAVVRVLLSYFMEQQRDNLADIDIPRDSVFLLKLVCVHSISKLSLKENTHCFYCRDTDIRQEPYGISLQCFCFDHEKGLFHQIVYPSEH